MNDSTLLSKIIIEDNFISKEECEYLVNVVKDCDLWESGGSDFWKDRVINYSKLLRLNEEASSIMLQSNIKCNRIISEFYKLEKKISNDTLQIIRWFPDMEQAPHADDMKNTSVRGFENRVFGSIIYLNDEYEGGQTYYPNLNFKVTAKKGSLIVHPGDERYLHGVSKIQGAVRYTIASFWIFDK